MHNRKLFISVQLLFLSINAIDNVHFYRPNFFWGEPRLECPWLTTIQVAVGQGSARKGFNSSGKKTDVLNIYGLQNMHKLADNVPDLNPENPSDAILINLNKVPGGNNFGQLKLKGTFSIIEGVIDIYQNIDRGFFFELYIPARKLSLRPNITSYDDLKNLDQSSHGSLEPNKKTPEWQAFLTNFFSILQDQGITLNGVHRAGIGDLTLLGGWTCSCQNTQYLDFIDVSAKIGVLFPTGKKTNPDNPFDLPQGYNGHWGAPLKFDASIGAWEWFTCGLHIGALFLAEKDKTVRIRTSDEQNGYIKLAKGEASVDPGIYYDFDLFAKADHFCKGLSILLAYAFNTKEKDMVEPKDKKLFDSGIANRDLLLAGWNQQVFQIIVEYDFAKKITDVGTRISLFYNHTIDGKRILRTDMGGGYLGLDVICCF